jgi:NAD-dependent dihydropyrimidine dehydrogenase PreA subunit
LIKVDLARCNGCGACVAVCPEGALYLVDDKVMVDASLCRECEACVVACPVEAIAITAEEARPALAPAGVAVAETMPMSPSPRPKAAVVPMRARVLPLVGAVLTWAGREIVPKLADHLLHSLDRWAMRQEVASSPRRASNPRAQRQEGGGGGHRRWRRHRGQ